MLQKQFRYHNETFDEEDSHEEYSWDEEDEEENPDLEYADVSMQWSQNILETFSWRLVFVVICIKSTEN